MLIPKLWSQRVYNELTDDSFILLNIVQRNCPKHEAKFTFKFWIKKRYCKHCFIEMRVS